MTRDADKTGWDVVFRPLPNGEVECLLPDELSKRLQLREGQKANVWAEDGKILIQID